MSGLVGMVMGVLVLWGVWLTVSEWRSKLRNLTWWFGIALAAAIGVALIVSGYHSVVPGHH